MTPRPFYKNSDISLSVWNKLSIIKFECAAAGDTDTAYAASRRTKLLVRVATPTARVADAIDTKIEHHSGEPENNGRAKFLILNYKFSLFKC